MKPPTLKVGDKVRATPKHWLRPNQSGKIVEISRGKFLILFSKRYVGGGLDGDKLWLDDSQFKRL